MHPTSIAACAALLSPLAAAQAAGWPPEPDPQWNNGQIVSEPASGEHLYIAGHSMIIPDWAPGWPAGTPIGDWLTHNHGTPTPISGCVGYGGIQTDVSVGDVDNDGVADDVVITMSGEAVFAATMVYDDIAGTYSLDPLWFWLSPYASGSGWLGGTPSHPDNLYSCYSSHRNNPVIWNIVDDQLGGGPNPDSTNEVAFVGLENDGTHVGEQALFILRTDPTSPRNVKLVAQSPANDTFRIEHRIGICKTRDTAFPRDLILTQHNNGSSFIWQETAGPVDGIEHRFSATFDNSVLQVTTSWAHKYNWLDIDGDGFDEFFQNGLIDFVDRDPDTGAIMEYGTQGKRRWQIVDSGLNGDDGDDAHIDALAVGDFDPLRPGLELLAVMDDDADWANGSWKQWVDGGPPIDHPNKWDTLWDADCGELLSEWASAPADGGQSVHAGNWSAEVSGLESIHSPKDFDDIFTTPNGQGALTASYATGISVTSDPLDDLDFNLLANSGLIYDGPKVYNDANTVLARSMGPWRDMHTVDWDGNYASEEILQFALSRQPFSIFRMGAKSELGTGPWPYGVPDAVQVQDSPVIQPPEDDLGCSSPTGAWIYYYQGDCGNNTAWNWNNNGPGLGTHFYEKLKAAYPKHPFGDLTLAHGALIAKPFDVGIVPGQTPPGGLGDYREEIIAVSRQISASEGLQASLHIYYNDAPLAPGTLVRPSPNESPTYARLRQSQPHPPMYFAEAAVTIDRFWIQPTNPALPQRAFGMAPLGSATFEAFVEFSNGDVSDVTTLVSFVQDAHSTAHLSLSGATVTSLASDTISGRFHAELMVDGETRISDPTYVFVSDEDEAVVLRAGFLDTWLVNDMDHDDRPLRIEAYAAQKSNMDLIVKGLMLDGTSWDGIELFDDGLGADEVAGDGVYTIEVDPTTVTHDSSNVSLRTIVATPAPIGTNPPIQLLTDPAPWPFAWFGGNTTPPATAPTAAPSVNLSWEAPRISSMGYRGWHAPGEMLLEVHVTDSPYRPESTDLLLAYSAGTYIGYLIPEGNGIHTMFVSGSNLSGLHLIDLVPWSAVGTQSVHGDQAPRLTLHAAGFPAWDVDEPVQCDGGEPAGW